MNEFLAASAAIGALVIVLKKVVKKKKSTEIKRGDIRFNYRHNHLAHIKKVEGKPPSQNATSVFLSTKNTDEGKENIPMDKPIKLKSGKTEAAYFIKRVRSYPVETYSNEKLDQELSSKDKKTSNEIYKKHLTNQELMKKRK